MNAADKIKTPLLVAQGANDPRVNRREAEQIVIALRDRGFPVEYILAPDEGHGFARPINNLALFMASEKFFAQHLGGKYQEGGTSEEVARLKEITVDPKTVVLVRKIDAGSISAPKPAMDLQAGTYNYQVKIEMGGQQMNMKLSTTVQDGWLLDRNRSDGYATRRRYRHFDAGERKLAAAETKRQAGPGRLRPQFCRE